MRPRAAPGAVTNMPRKERMLGANPGFSGADTNFATYAQPTRRPPDLRTAVDDAGLPLSKLEAPRPSCRKNAHGGFESGTCATASAPVRAAQPLRLVAPAPGGAHAHAALAQRTGTQCLTLGTFSPRSLVVLPTSRPARLGCWRACGRLFCGERRKPDCTDGLEPVPGPAPWTYNDRPVRDLQIPRQLRRRRMSSTRVRRVRTFTRSPRRVFAGGCRGCLGDARSRGAVARRDRRGGDRSFRAGRRRRRPGAAQGRKTDVAGSMWRLWRLRARSCRGSSGVCACRAVGLRPTAQPQILDRDGGCSCSASTGSSRRVAGRRIARAKRVALAPVQSADPLATCCHD